MCFVPSQHKMLWKYYNDLKKLKSCWPSLITYCTSFPSENSSLIEVLTTLLLLFLLQVSDQLLLFVTRENKRWWQILHFLAKCFWSAVSVVMNAFPLHPPSLAFSRLVRSWKARGKNAAIQQNSISWKNYLIFFPLWPKWKTYCSERAVQTELPKPFINKETVMYQTSGVDVNYNN